MSFNEEVSERRLVEDYLKLYCIEELIDEALNDVCEKRPANPYVEIARLIEKKTLPEIIDVKLSSICCANGTGGVRAMVITNLDSFEGLAGGPLLAVSGTDRLRDFTILESKVSAIMKSLDPREMSNVDDLIVGIPDMDDHVCCALSIACCRAGARHKGLPLHQYISFLAQTEACLSMPIVTVLSRVIGNDSSFISQDITLTPTSCSTIDNAIEACLQGSSQVKSAILDRIREGGMDVFELQPSCGGCPRARISTLDAACQVYT